MRGPSSQTVVPPGVGITSTAVAEGRRKSRSDQIGGMARVVVAAFRVYR